jgi:hypothetical protein
MRVSGLVLCLEIVGAVPLDLRAVDEELHLISAFVVGFPAVVKTTFCIC